MAYEVCAAGLAGLSARPLMRRRPRSVPAHLNDVDALLAPRWSGYGGAPAVFSGAFVRQLMTLTGPGLRRRAAIIRLTTFGLTAYSITSSASASTLTGTSSPIALAVLRLRTRSYREG